MSGYINSPAHQFRQSLEHHSGRLQSIAADLEKLAHAFDEVGNETVGRRLWDASDSLLESLAQLRSADVDKISYECDESFRMMSSTFAAAQAVLGQVGGVGVGLGSVDVG